MEFDYVRYVLQFLIRLVKADMSVVTDAKHLQIDWPGFLQHAVIAPALRFQIAAMPSGMWHCFGGMSILPSKCRCI